MRHERPCYFVTVTFHAVATRIVRLRVTERRWGRKRRRWGRKRSHSVGLDLEFLRRQAGRQAGDRRLAGPK